MGRLLRPALQAGAFLIGASAVGWPGAVLDAFVFPMDVTSSRALGGPDFAYPVILISHLLVAAVGATIFGLAAAVLQSERRLDARVLTRAALLGSTYAVVLEGLLHLVIWADTPPGPAIFWLGILTLPIGAAWLGVRYLHPRGAGAG